MKNVTVDENEYVIGKMNAIEQFHLARRLLPLFASIEQNNGGSPDLKGMMVSLGALSDADAEKIIFPCLTVVRRIVAGQQQPILVRNRLMFDDLKITGIFELMLAVIEENIGGFLERSGPTSGEPAAPPQA